MVRATREEAASTIRRTLRHNTPTTLSPRAVASSPALDTTMPAGAVGVLRPKLSSPPVALLMSRNGEAVDGALSAVTSGGLVRGEGVADALAEVGAEAEARDRVDVGDVDADF